MSQAGAQLAFGFAYVYQREIEQRARDVLPNERFIDIHFADLVRDPQGTVASVYRRLGWPFREGARERVAAYAAEKPKDSRGPHRYSLSEVGLDAREERERFAFYMAEYGVPEES